MFINMDIDTDADRDVDVSMNMDIDIDLVQQIPGRSKMQYPMSTMQD